ncbi:MAG: AraC family transcriptional regulator [Clostridia bacterium]|nr:AraC family transcriptional regulator [Clostridia bacterium]
MHNRNEYFLINKQLHGFNPLSFGQEHCLPHHFFGPGVRSYWLLHYIVSGNGVFSVRDKTYKLTSGSCFIIRPFEKVFYQADSVHPWHYIWIGFEAPDHIPEQLSGDVLNIPGMGSIFDSIMEAQDKNEGRNEFLSGKIWELMSLISEANKPKISKNKSFAEQAKTCIQAKYMTGITVAEIAKTLNLERSYFSTVFKNSIGISPQEYLNNFRLEKAADLLVSSNLSVTDIAFSTGYSGVINFSRMFKRRFGTSPTEYREANLKS